MPASSLTGQPRQQLPDALGRFGAFGGRFVPETLMDALNRLAEEYERAKADPDVPGSAGRLPGALRRTALAAVSRRAAEPDAGRGGDLSEARGPEPHRGAQDQQRAGAGPAGPADGQDPRDRRDRRGAARRRHRDGLRPVRARVHGLHGGGGHPPPEAQRLQHEDLGGHRRARRRPARGRSATRPTRRCATGWPRRGRRITRSAASSGRTRFR